MSQDKKKVLLIGGGGREHAIAWRLERSPRLGKLYVAPGNAGTSQIAENVPLIATDINGLLDFALKKKVDLTIVGPDDPLALGIVDAFQAKGQKIFGPTKAAAQIESSKVFSKKLMGDCGVPTAPFEVYIKYTEAIECVSKHFGHNNLPIVIKASGLALGKGAYVCSNLSEARQALGEIMIIKAHGRAGDQVIIEGFVDGPEISAHAFCDGKSFKLFPSAQDHKPIFDGDQGPNTGGMGAIAPVPWFDQCDVVGRSIVRPILAGLQKNNSPFVGLLYPGLKVLGHELTTLEFNARFGDPETQVYMRLLKTDLLDIIEACVEGRLHEIEIEWHPGFAVCVVIASSGYPSAIDTRKLPITGIDKAESIPGIVVFHAGTKIVGNQLVASGGRVLGVTGVGMNLRDTIYYTYKGVEEIHFEGMQYRRDIGAKSRAMAR
ncbi:MAG: phosphoribosylamine--glycine ligase [Candidatus Paceibacterota bacterium]|jgi:phosphoribosylamine--glycine ligase